MASTYTNDLRLELIAVGEGSGTAPNDWGSKTNVNLTSIASAFGPGTENLASDADATLTLADGTADEMRALYLKITSSGSLTATRTITIAPNTVAKLWIIENATTGGQSITLSQGTGANVTVANSAVKLVYTDGAGSGAAVIDALVDLDLTGTTTIATAAVTNLTLGGTAISATGTELNIMDGVTSTTAELNILDGVTATTAEINIVDGDTSATATTLADADRVVVNDGGTMVQVALTDFETYFETSLDTLSNVTTVGALNAGSITSGFGAINNGSSAITTTGTITYGSLSDGSITITAFVDEDNMVSNSATMVPTQQSVKAYVDTQVGASPSGTATYANFDVTTSLQIPDGTTGERPSSPSVGNLRYNTTTGAVEIYHTSGWGALNTVVDGSITTAKLDDDAVTTAKIADDNVTSAKLAHTLDIVTSATFGGASNGVAISQGAIALKNGGSVSKIDFYCESSNAHYTRLQSAPHASYSGNITLTLPASDGDAGQFLKTDGSGVMSWAAAGGAYNDWTVKTGTYTAVSKDQLICNHASTAFTITLPASPSEGDTVTLKNVGAALVTVGRNSEKIDGATEDGTLPTGNAVQLVYTNDAAIGWTSI